MKKKYCQTNKNTATKFKQCRLKVETYCYATEQFRYHFDNNILCVAMFHRSLWWFRVIRHIPEF